MAKKTGKKLTLISVLSLLVILALSFCIALIMQRTKINQNKTKAFYLEQSIKSNISSDFNSYIDILSFIESLTQEQNVELSSYLDFEIQLMEKNKKALKSLQVLSKKGYSYGWKRSSVSYDEHFKELCNSQEVNYSRITGKTILVGPFSLNGERLIVILNPIYQEQASGISDFWGFAAAYIELDSLFNLTNFQNIINMGYAYKLVKIDGETKEGYEILSSQVSNKANWYSSSFTVDDFELELSLYPVHGWINIFDIVTQFFITFLAAVLTALMAWLLFYLSQKEKVLSRYSYLDSLTALNNARKFSDDIKELQSNNSPYGILYLDLNDFKPVNDQYGHLTGNKLLTIIGKKLNNTIRSTDTAYRIGGDEFVIIVQGRYDKNHYELMSNRIRSIIETPIIIDEYAIKVGVSIGFASYPENGQASEEVIMHAEEMMYAEKRLRKANR